MTFSNNTLRGAVTHLVAGVAALALSATLLNSIIV